jgi:hypothetical protein
MPLTSDGDPCGTEYAYVLDPAQHTMDVYERRYDRPGWLLLSTVDFDGPEPHWGTLGEPLDTDRAEPADLVDLLRSVLHPDDVWREDLNGRSLVLIRHEGAEYCLLPLSYAPVVSLREGSEEA